jgi:hypothetical protein
MSALRTPQGRIRRQREFGIAFTADVSHRLHLGWRIAASTASAGAVAKGVLVVEGGDLVCFAGHFAFFFYVCLYLTEDAVGEKTVRWTSA